MRFQSSFGGAYDEALESSAEKIMLVVSQDYNRDNCSSGYSSDTEASEGQETESYSIADEPSSLSCSSSCASLSSSTSSSCGETSDIECEIEFLQEKQALLKRAVSALKSMEAYDASKARAVLNGTLPSGSPLWAEAKEVLEILNDNSSGGIRTTAAQTSTDKPPDAKRPRIDVSSVVCLSSNNIGNNVLAPSSWNRAIPAKPFACTGAWMAQVMAHFISSLSRQHDSTSTPSADSWEVISDPDLGLLVLPPPKLPFQNGVQLKDALGFTSVAQIITLSTPPFCVVHANKAFSMFSGLSNCTLVGKPIESILQVIQDIPTTYLCSTPTTVESLGSQIVSSNKPCQLRVVPITDRVRNSQGGMSHLLVKIEPSECQNSTINDTETKTSAPGGKGLDAHGNHRVFGTVG